MFFSWQLSCDFGKFCFSRFWSRTVKSFWQKQRFGWAWAKKNYIFQSWGSTKKHVFNTYALPSKMVMRAGNTIAFPCHFGYTCAFPCFLWKHILNVEIFEHHVYRCGNASLTHTRLQSLFMSLCGKTCVFTFSGSAKSRNWCVFPCFLL